MWFRLIFIRKCLMSTPNSAVNNIRYVTEDGNLLVPVQRTKGYNYFQPASAATPPESAATPPASALRAKL